MKRLIWSNFAAQLAEQISLAAIPLVAVLAFGAGAGETGVLQTAQTLPFLLLALPAGLLADRLSRTRLMVSGEALRTVSLLCIAALIFYGGASLPPLGAPGTLRAGAAAVCTWGGDPVGPAYGASRHVGVGRYAAAWARSTRGFRGPGV